jgi:hypothetical protein
MSPEETLNKFCYSHVEFDSLHASGLSGNSFFRFQCKLKLLQKEKESSRMRYWKVYTILEKTHVGKRIKNSSYYKIC